MTPLKTILYPTDFSGPSQYALGLACALARDQGARLIALHIVPSPVPVTWGANIWELGTAGPCQHDLKRYREETRAKLERLPLPGLALPVERLLKEGDVPKVILETARETCCDLIVMGSHGLTGEGWRLMGSVAEEVAQNAPCPVLYVKVPLANKEYRTMAMQIAQKTQQQEEAAPRGGALAPLREFPFFLSRMRDKFDRLLDRLSRRWPSFWEGNGWRRGLDVRDEDDAVVVQAEAPGFEAGDFDIQVSDNRLVLRASKKVETKGEEGKTREYREQACYESVTLPTGIDRDKVEAKYHNGVLTVRLPKTPEAKGRRVPVKSA